MCECECVWEREKDLTDKLNMQFFFSLNFIIIIFQKIICFVYFMWILLKWLNMINLQKIYIQSSRLFFRLLSYFEIIYVVHILTIDIAKISLLNSISIINI